MNTLAEAHQPRVQLTFFNLPVTEQASRYQKSSASRIGNTGKRNERIRLRFNYLYNEERKRIDDIIMILCDEFSLTKRSIQTALKG